MKKVAIITSSPMTVNAFLIPFIKILQVEYEVHIIANFGTDLNVLEHLPSVKVHSISLERNPNFFKDLSALYSLYTLLKINKFDIIHTFTPKAGLIGQLSAFLARVPIRFHTFTGQVWATKKGVKKLLLKFFDWTISNLALYCLVDSPSQRRFLIEEKIISPIKSRVLGSGSISGVNFNKFKYSKSKAISLKKELGLLDCKFIFLYAGRLKVDKGIPELFRAFELISNKYQCHLLIVGTDEENLLPLIQGNKNISFCGFSDDITTYFSAADLLCLPSHREGFGNVVIEAAACGLPSLASNIYGLSDAIENGVTGILHEVNNVDSITAGMDILIRDPKYLKEVGMNAENRAQKNFSEDFIVDQFIKFYREFSEKEIKCD
jgi:glycosyltransferase involved in cell wall biosynthesis